MKKHLDIFKKRSLSWSSISQWNYDKDAWARKYLLGIQDPPNAQMNFGKHIGQLLASIPDFLPMVPRYSVFEKELKVKFGSIPLVGYLDSYDPNTHAFFEYKTHSRADKWTQKSAEAHGQLLMYKAMLYMLYDIAPERIGCELIAIPVEEAGDFKMTLSKKPCQIFEVKHTKIEVLNFLIELKKTYKTMCDMALHFKE